MSDVLIGSETFSNQAKKGQVFLATHNGEGKRLPHFNRAYISFTFGGRYIEDFSLIATMKDRLNKNIYANFSDSTSNYETLDGQYHWGTHMEANGLEFTLSTDGMLQEELEDFKEWFRPGVERELILSEHPNRVIMARVSSPPQMSMIPYEEERTFSYNNNIYTAKTASYRGDITLAFVMDDPFWYSKLNYIPTYIDPDTLEEKTNADENAVMSLENEDMKKIFIEDRLPLQAPLFENLFLGNDSIVKVSSPKVGSALVGLAVLGIKMDTTEGITIDKNNFGYLFYSGTAPSYPLIKFSITPSFDANGYINNINNKYSSIDDSTYIQVGDNRFYFTLPSLWRGYNEAVKIMNMNWVSTVELREQLMDKVHEYYSRAWAVNCVDTVNSLNKENLLAEMKKFFIQDEEENEQSEEKKNGKATFYINSKTGESIGEFNVYIYDNDGVVTPKLVKENVGDMIASNYLYIDKRNLMPSDGTLSGENCTKISSNIEINDFLILYKNMYL